MLVVSVGAMAMVPLWVGYVYFQKNPEVGRALFFALISSVAAALIFQFLAMRPRPEGARLIIPQLAFQSYPSGHAAGAFAVAMIYALRRRTAKRWAIALLGAGLIGISRILSWSPLPFGCAGRNGYWYEYWDNNLWAHT